MSGDLGTVLEKVAVNWTADEWYTWILAAAYNGQYTPFEFPNDEETFFIRFRKIYDAASQLHMTMRAHDGLAAAIRHWCKKTNTLPILEELCLAAAHTNSINSIPAIWYHIIGDEISGYSDGSELKTRGLLTSVLCGFVHADENVEIFLRSLFEKDEYAVHSGQIMYALCEKRPVKFPVYLPRYIRTVQMPPTDRDIGTQLERLRKLLSSEVFWEGLENAEGWVQRELIGFLEARNEQLIGPTPKAALSPPGSSILVAEQPTGWQELFLGENSIIYDVRNAPVAQKPRLRKVQMTIRYERFIQERGAERLLADPDPFIQAAMDHLIDRGMGES